MKILVQNIYSLETLAHVDTLCLDKTGTITNGKLTVDTVMEIGAGLLGKALPQGEPENSCSRIWRPPTTTMRHFRR